MIPTRMFFTKGVGRHKEQLQSFELALRNARIEKYNIVHVSSIFPPGCRIVPRHKALLELSPGQIIYAVMARNSTNEPSRLVAASVGLALPAEADLYGYLSEHHSFGYDRTVVGDYAEDLAASMLATTLGIEFDPEEAWDQRKEIYKASGKIFRTRSYTQQAIGSKDGTWTTVVAAAVFIV
jgi:arginine decarboxylase